jgi:hypothetical protein
MEPIPMEWVDKLFNCMTSFYGERWTRNFSKINSEDIQKVIWKNGLIGLTYEDIKNTLILCKRSALDQHVNPPHVMEFFQYAKGYTRPYINDNSKKEQEVNMCDPEIQKQSMNEIRKRLGMTVKN